MTEDQWPASADAGALLARLTAEAKRHRRRLRLFSVACCRRLGRWIINERLWKCLDAAERYADGRLKDSGLDHWTAEANRSWQAAEQPGARIRNRPAVVRAHHAIAYTCLSDRYRAYARAAPIILGASKEFGGPFVREMRSLFPRLLRDIFGNPFRPVPFDRAWRTAAVVGLAETIYADRDFNLMPVLGDALEEAGCDEEGVLRHCRDPQQVHVRGCWVVDLVLGRPAPRLSKRRT
jgi:hypothetical protein